MKIFLTSVAWRVLDNIISHIKASGGGLRVAFIPTAANIYINRSFVDDDKNKLLELGCEVTEINIAGQTEKYLEKKLEGADIIFVAGGNSFYLLEQSISSGFDMIVKGLVRSGTYYIGSSAGSVIMGSSIEHVKTLDNPKEAPNLKSFEGFGLTDNIIIPHHKNPKYSNQIDQIIEHYSKSNEIIALMDNQFAIIDDQDIKIVTT